METLPLTNPQRRIWFAEVENPGTNINNISFLCKTPARSLGEMEKAWNTLLQSAEAYRFRLLEQSAPGDNFPISQRVIPFEAVELKLHSFQSQEAADIWMKAEAEKPFQLLGGPLWRSSAVKVGDEQAKFFVVVHHIISDGASVKLTSVQLSQILNGEAITGGNYFDFAAHAEAYKKTPKYSQDRAYWLAENSKLPEPINLGFGKGNGKPLLKSLKFRKEVAEKSAEFASRHRLSSYKQVATALEVVLSRSTRSKTFVLGMANHNRSKPEFLTIHGMFVSTLPLVMNYRGEASYLDRCTQLAQQINRAVKEHAQYPLEDMVVDCREELGFDLGSLLKLNLVGHPVSPESPLILHPGTAPGGLNIHVNMVGTVQPGELGITFSADGSLYTEAGLLSLFRSLETVLEAGLENPDALCRDLPLLTSDEWSRLMAFNGPYVPYPTSNFPENFASTVAANPDKLAVIAGEQRLSFAELDAWSDQLALALAGNQGKFVGVCCRRDASLLAAVLGVIKAGAAYVPMDPNYPQERLRYMAEDSGMQVVLVHSEYERVLPESLKTLDLDQIERSGQRKPLLNISPEDRAYAIYTSGTTGKPKGVPIHHHQLNHLCQALAKPFQIGEDSVCLLFASLNFDASVAEIFLPLIHGATLVIANNQDREDGERLLALLDKHQVSFAIIPPALLAVLPSAELPHLKNLVVAGEATDPQVIERWASGRRMINAYGPTECTVAVSAAEFGDGGSRDIGPPIDNIHCYVLDEGQKPVPLGMPGELFAAGPSISEGYLGRPELTEQRFLPNPFAKPELQNPRMYKTGDLVRWLPSGHLEFIGRVDFQVKIRGHRIECGEVSDAIAKIEGVESCLVVPVPSGSTHRLVAYLLGQEDLDSASLRAATAEQLPDYMVPSAFVLLKEFPMTPNGKVDRRALPVPQEQSRPYRAPESAVQHMLCRIWKLLLPSERVGIDDDFFELGGDSLSCMRMVAEVKEEGFALDVETVRKHPTIAKLSAALGNSKLEKVLPPLKADHSKDPFLLSQNTLMMARQTENLRKAGAELALTVTRWTIRGPLQVNSCLEALDKLADDLDVFRLALNGDFLSPVELSPHKLERVENLDDELKAWSQNSDLGPRCGFRLFELAPEHFALAFRVDHEVLDGWSLKLVLKRLNALYQGQSPERPLQFRDFCSWYQQLLENKELEDSKNHWTRVLSLSQALYPEGLGADDSAHPYAPIMTMLPLEKTLREKFEAVCRENQSTLFEGSYALYNMLWARRSQTTRVLTGYVSALRDSASLQEIVGSLTNRLYLSLEVDQDDPFSEVVARVQKELALNRTHGTYPAWGLCDKQGQGFPGLFFHYVPRGDSNKPAMGELEMEGGGPPPPTAWPLGLAFQLVDHEETPALVILARAGFTNRELMNDLMGEYRKLMQEITAKKESKSVVSTGT